MRVLIIKLTSMGDLMHALPALSDAQQHYPDIEFDWVVDENFAQVPLWHPRVRRVIKTAHRRWKKNLSAAIKQGQLQAFYRQLNRERYDVIVDLQGNLKSACVAWLRQGKVHGYDRGSCREKPAHWAYACKHAVAKQQHAVVRQRQLMAKALSYAYRATPADYGVDLSVYPLPAINLPNKPLIFVHNASRPDKMWPLEAWRDLTARATAAGYPVLLPCGNESEHQRAQQIAAGNTGAIALPKLSLNAMAAIIASGRAAVCSDTGLAHLAAVAGTPSLTLYATTDSRLIGTEGKHQYHRIAGKGQQPASMAMISVEQVWAQLQKIAGASPARPHPDKVGV
ncbi:MAG: lipopolysaccharide heptosyltransferase I [Cellvibrionaceae bacterium]|nr:lipopolysaccharide heptosyltransferase I [Cellvibrionaceae bacterium]